MAYYIINNNGEIIKPILSKNIDKVIDFIENNFKEGV